MTPAEELGQSFINQMVKESDAYDALLAVVEKAVVRIAQLGVDIMQLTENPELSRAVMAVGEDLLAARDETLKVLCRRDSET